MTAHTPGPWTMRNEYRKKEERVKYNPGNRFVVYSDGLDGHGKGNVMWSVADEIESEANARLIAAAPRMYDALRAIDGMKITEETDKGYVLAMCMTIARIELENIEGRE